MEEQQSQWFLSPTTVISYLEKTSVISREAIEKEIFQRFASPNELFEFLDN